MSMFNFKDVNIEMLCGSCGITNAVVQARTETSVVVRTPQKYGHSMRPALVRVCQSLQTLTCETYVYSEEAYPNCTILTFSKVG